MLRTRLGRIATAGTAIALCAAFSASVVTSAPASAGGVPGLTSTSITIGATVPLTGIASPGYDEVGKAARAVFDYVNAHGKVNGRTIKFILKDDCYDTPGFGCEYGNSNSIDNETVTQTEALLATSGGLFATVGGLGTPTQDSVRSLLNSSGTPQLFVNSGSRDWNNPSTYPDLFGWQPSYITEAKVLGLYMKQHLATEMGGTSDPSKLCFLGQNDDFGGDGEIGLHDAGLLPSVAESSPTTKVEYYSTVDLVILGSSYFKSFIQGFQTAGCKVVFLDTIPAATSAALTNALSLHYKPQWVISSVGADPITLAKVLPKADRSAHTDPEVGAISFSYLNASTSTAKNAKLWKSFEDKVLEADHADFPGFKASTPIDGNMAYGIAWGVAFVEALKAAGSSFTQASFVHLLQTSSFKQTPSLTPLAYTASNHQGLLGGYVIKIASPTSTSILNATVYNADSGANDTVTKATVLSSGMPSWL